VYGGIDWNRFRDARTKHREVSGTESEFGPGEIWSDRKWIKPSQVIAGTGANMEGTNGKGEMWQNSP